MKAIVKRVRPEIRAIQYKPEDFYCHDTERGDFYFDFDAISKALSLAKYLVDNGPRTSGLILSCKISTGIRNGYAIVQSYRVK